MLVVTWWAMECIGMVLVRLLGAYRVGHRSIGARGCVLVGGLALLRGGALLLLLLLEKIMLPAQ